MRPLFRFLFLSAVLLPLGTALADDLRVDVVVNVTDAGKKVIRPSLEQPAYYLPIPAGYKELGRYMGPQKAIPVPSEAEAVIVRALAEQGYRVMTKQSAPTLAIVFNWGYIAPRFVRGPKTPLVNLPEMLSMVAGDSRYDQDPHDPRIQEAMDATRLPRYYVLISAFDFQDWLHHKSTLLWRAHISTWKFAHNLGQVLPTLVETAAPSFGREVAVPTFVTAPRLGHVIMGRPQVVPDASNPAPAPNPKP